MSAPSNEVLDERFNNMEKQNTLDNKTLEIKLDSIISMLDNKYVLKSSFKVAVAMLWLFATILALASYIWSIKL